MSRAATASVSAPETARSVSVRSAPELPRRVRLSLTAFIWASSRSLAAATRVALADGVLQALAHQVERGGELAALLDRLQDRGLLPADLLHRDLEAVLRRAGLGGALVALGGERLQPRLVGVWITTAWVAPRSAATRSITTVAVATAIQPIAASAAVPESELRERGQPQVPGGVSRLDEQPFFRERYRQNAVQPT